MHVNQFFFLKKNTTPSVPSKISHLIITLYLKKKNILSVMSIEM